MNLKILGIAASQYFKTYGSHYANELSYSSYVNGMNWCGLFAGWVLKENGLEIPEKFMVARSYLKYGVEVSRPFAGDVVVFWRVSRNSWQGHVGFFVREAGSGHIWVLGGNQQGKVCTQKMSLKRLLGYRRYGEIEQ